LPNTAIALQCVKNLHVVQSNVAIFEQHRGLLDAVDASAHNDDFFASLWRNLLCLSEFCVIQGRLRKACQSAIFILTYDARVECFDGLWPAGWFRHTWSLLAVEKLILVVSKSPGTIGRPGLDILYRPATDRGHVFR
jgi:hypothetical protein